MKKIAAIVLVTALLSPVVATSAKADDGRHWDGFRHEDHDRGRGHWYHGWHHGRQGRWWIVGSNWYYNAPPAVVYPAPYVYRTPVYVAPAPAPYWYYRQRW